LNDKPISEAKDADLRNSQTALERAAKRARDIAVKTNTPLVVKRNGKTTLVDPTELKNSQK